MTRASLGPPRGSHAPREAVTITASEALLASDSGKIFMLNLATGLTVTLPSVANAGWYATFIIATNCSSNDYIIDAAATVVCSGIEELETDTNDDGPTDTAHDDVTFASAKDQKGDMCEIFSDGTSWYVNGVVALDACVSLA